MRTRHTTDDDILIASYLDGTLTGSDLERFRARITANRNVMEIVESMHEVIGNDNCDEYGQAPDHLLERAIALYPEKPGLMTIILAIAKQYISVIACPDNYTLLNPEQACCVRGGGSMTVSPRVVMARVFDTIQVEVEAERPLQGSGCTIRLNVLPTQPQMNSNKFRVFFASTERELYSGSLENDAIAFEDISPGNYIITIKNRLKIVGEISLKLEEDNNGGHHEQQ
ncbi:MAG: hypothetical protein HY888_08370 [Deltaproteobacteria bacterium]|nr:hypothetical protein [Deltaproteobacteria bacterium]